MRSVRRPRRRLRRPAHRSSRPAPADPGVKVSQDRTEYRLQTPSRGSLPESDPAQRVEEHRDGLHPAPAGPVARQPGGRHGRSAATRSLGLVGVRAPRPRPRALLRYPCPDPVDRARSPAARQGQAHPAHGRRQRNPLVQASTRLIRRPVPGALRVPPPASVPDAAGGGAAIPGRRRRPAPGPVRLQALETPLRRRAREGRIPSIKPGSEVAEEGLEPPTRGL